MAIFLIHQLSVKFTNFLKLKNKQIQEKSKSHLRNKQIKEKYYLFLTNANFENNLI